MPVTTCPVGEWTAIPQETGGTRLSARGAGFYVLIAATPPLGTDDVGDAKALSSGESIFIEPSAPGVFVQPSNSVRPAYAYTQAAITQETNAR